MNAVVRIPRLTAQQHFVLMEMRRDACSQAALSGHYTRSRMCLQAKGVLGFDADKGRYVVTELGLYALAKEAARRSA